VTVESFQAPRCDWERGGHIHHHSEVRQAAGTALSTPACSVASFPLRGLWLPCFGPAPTPWLELGEEEL